MIWQRKACWGVMPEKNSAVCLAFDWRETEKRTESQFCILYALMHYIIALLPWSMTAVRKLLFLPWSAQLPFIPFSAPCSVVRLLSPWPTFPLFHLACPDMRGWLSTEKQIYNLWLSVLRETVTVQVSEEIIPKATFILCLFLFVFESGSLYRHQTSSIQMWC